MEFRLKRYKKTYPHSYTFGVFPTLEVCHHRPQDIIGVVIHPRGQGNRGVDKLLTFCQERGVPAMIQENTFSRLGARDNDYALGVFRKTEPALDPATDHVVLVNPSGMGNLGTIIRTMLGFGFLDLAIIQPAADIFHPEVVRASMGALFQLRFQRFPDFDTYQRTYPRNWYPLLTEGATPLPAVCLESPFGLIFGNESAGLPPAFNDLGTGVRIPQNERIDSLNLAVSVGVTLYQASQR
jgi:TrmH family RNA methyltransferase